MKKNLKKLSLKVTALETKAAPDELGVGNVSDPCANFTETDESEGSYQCGGDRGGAIGLVADY